MVTEMEEKQWIRYLIPLPHEITIEDQIRCNPKDISIQLRPNAGAVEQQGVHLR